MADSTTTLAPLAVRRDADIYEIDGGWFHARWHFSFDRYHDPEQMGIGYLRVFNHDTLRPGAIWPMHPHRDIEGITYVVAGEFEHADNLGNGGVLLPGGVQRMTLGRGADHSERNHSATEEMQFIQMWIMPDRRGLEPAAEQRQWTESDRHNCLLQILQPERIGGDALIVHQDASMYVSRLDAGVPVEHIIGPGRGGYFYVIDGKTNLNGESLSRGDAAKIFGAGTLRVEATSLSELLLIDTPL
jgi:redox-sensitive bicupin YhaK (pirin superfamily)